MNLDYGVCEKLCVPVQAMSELALGRAASQFDAALAAAEARVPVPTQLGEGKALSVRAVRRDNGGATPRVVVDVMAPEQAMVDLFAEGPTPDWALPLPAPT